MKKFLPFIAFCLFLSGFTTSAHRIEFYTTNGCIDASQALTINARVVYAPSNTNYNWQFKGSNGTWICFQNGNNTINGSVFNVTNAWGTGANSAPALTIANPSSVLHNVQIRCLMREGASPCGAPAGTTYGGDDLALNEVKVLRLNYNASAATCSISCDNNLLSNANGYYGGFEAVAYANEVFTDRNFLAGSGATDYSTTGTGTGTYRSMNNPYAAFGFSNAKFAPHSGNYQMVVKGNTTAATKVWYKTITVQPGSVYSFSVWAAKVDATAPRIQLKANNLELAAALLSATTGNWTQITGTYAVPPGVTSVTFAISDKDAGSGAHNYVLDDICLVKTANPISIGDKVWNDVNRNGQQDNGEPGVAGVTVKLFYDNNDDNVADSANATYTATTNSSGIYTFSGVIPGKYFVQFSIPAGYSGYTIQDAPGVPVGQNSTANVNTGKTGTHNFTADYYFKDAGLVILPDLTPTIDINSLNFQEGASRDFVVNLFEINNVTTFGAISFRVSKISGWNITVPGIVLSASDQGGISGTSAVLGGIPNQNGNWLFRETSGFIIITAKPGVNINASGGMTIGFNAKRKTGVANNTTQNITAVIVNGSGGEVNVSNNQVVTSISATQ